MDLLAHGIHRCSTPAVQLVKKKLTIAVETRMSMGWPHLAKPLDPDTKVHVTKPKYNVA